MSFTAMLCYRWPQRVHAWPQSSVSPVSSPHSVISRQPALVLRIRAQWQDRLAVGLAGSGRFPALEMMRCLWFANLSISQNRPEGWLSTDEGTDRAFLTEQVWKRLKPRHPQSIPRGCALLLPGSGSSFQAPGYERPGISRNRRPRLSSEAEPSTVLISEAAPCAGAWLPTQSVPHGDHGRRGHASRSLGPWCPCCF